MNKLGNELIHLMEDLSELSTNGKAKVKVNKNLCNPAEFKQLFNYFTKGTILERVDLHVEPLETRLNCICGNEKVVNKEDHEGYDKCSECGRIANIDDKGYRLVEPDPEKTEIKKKIKF